MTSRMPPRYLPTLTEVVHPRVREGSVAPATVPVPNGVPAMASQQTAAPGSTPSHAGAPDRHALAQQLIRLVQPQLEAELRSIAQELFEAQFAALLPSMHLHIEEAVREAIEQALPEQHNGKE